MMILLTLYLATVMGEQIGQQGGGSRQQGIPMLTVSVDDVVAKEVPGKASHVIHTHQYPQHPQPISTCLSPQSLSDDTHSLCPQP